MPPDWIESRLDHVPVHRGTVLDLACGGGRHTRSLLQRGASVCALDIDLAGVRDLHDHPRIELIQADLESRGWPFGSARFAGILVCNYLHRPLFPAIADSLAPGGWLLYETFACGNERYGRPRNPDFLLRPGELRAAFGPLLEVLHFEDFTTRLPSPAVRQRLEARRRD